MALFPSPALRVAWIEARRLAFTEALRRVAAEVETMPPEALLGDGVNIGLQLEPIATRGFGQIELDIRVGIDILADTWPPAKERSDQE